MSLHLTELRRELSELNDVVQATEAAAQDATDAFAWDLSLQGLRSRRRQLLTEIQAACQAERVAEIQLRFEGAPVQSGTIEAGFLGEFLEYLQKLVFALGQAVASRPTARGTIPESVMERTRLRLAAVSPGSFTAELAGDAHPNLFGESLVQECFDNLHSLIETGDDAGRLADILGRLGGRVQGHYTAFLGSLTTASASVSLQTWLDATTAREVTISTGRARNITDALSLLQREEERLETVGGRLIGLLQHKAQFEFVGRTAEHVLAGKVLPTALERAVAYFNRDVEADFSVETVRVEGRDEVREHWTLTDLRPADPA